MKKWNDPQITELDINKTAKIVDGKNPAGKEVPGQAKNKDKNDTSQDESFVDSLS